MIRHGDTAVVAVAIGLLSAAPSPARLAAAEAAPIAALDAWASCRERLVVSPKDYESAYCFYTAALERRQWQEAVQVFEALLREHPDNFWLPLAYGHLHRSRWPGADLGVAETLYRRAADGFRAERHAEGEILALSNLRDILAPQGRIQEATTQVTRVVEIGTTINDPVLKAQVWTVEASHVLGTGGDRGHAYRLLKQTERAIFPDGPYRLRRTCLGWLGLVAMRMGRLDEAIGIFRRLDMIARAEGDAQSQATAQYNILNTESLKESMLPSVGGSERLMRLAEEALATGTRASHQAVTLKAHRVIADLLAQKPASQNQALEHAARCLELATDANRPEDEALCSWLMARLLHSTSPGQAQAAQLRALTATARANNPATEALTAGRHMQFSWLTKARPDAIRDSLMALGAIETQRSLQDTPQSSAEVFSIRTPDYYWLSGRLLQDAQEGDVDLAFSITERLRARALLDVRERSRTPPDPNHPSVVERRTLLREIAAMQRRLMDPTLAETERQTSLDRLEVLEEREQAAARLIALSAKNDSTVNPRVAPIAEVQAALAPDEALLSFQLGISETYEGDFGGGSWLIALTRDRRSVYRVPDRAHFAPLVPVFAGLLSRSDGLETSAAVRLYAEVFSEALRELPPGIDRLILLPDGPLQHLAFDALRPAPEAEPLGTRYELVVVPSATLWLEWRSNQSAPASRRVLALADPALDAGDRTTAPERQAVLQGGLSLGRLPHAQRESRAIQRQLGGVDALVGALASEHVVKTRDLRDYQIVHFAAHAIADDARPERSAVFLAPGSEEEDGLLQGREIRELDLDGRIIVLSACQTASGAVLSGEGVLSLARAFFEAGARAVVGTRWPIRDEDAASLFESFYRHLGQGASLSSALTQTRIDAIAAGRPPHAWAALVLIGDGTMQPFRPGTSDNAFTRSTILVLVLTCLLMGAGLVLFGHKHNAFPRR